MKRIASVLLFAVFACCATFAGENAPIWGVKVGVDTNLPGKWHTGGSSIKMYDTGYGFTVGPVFNVWLGKGFYFEPGANFFYDSYSYYELYAGGDSGAASRIDPSLYKLGVRVPLVVGYNIGSFVVFTGPELNYALGGKIRLADDDLYDNFPVELFDGFMRRFDCAWKIGAGVNVNNFLISLDGAIGMTDLVKNNVTFRENRITLAATYYF